LAAGPVVGVDVGIATHAGIEEQHPVGMVDEVPQTGLHSRQSVAGFGGRSDEVSEVHASYGRLTHIRQFDSSTVADPTARGDAHSQTANRQSVSPGARVIIESSQLAE
jgi:hypothetical protein